MVRDYTDRELLNRVRELKSFDGIPTDYWLLGVQSRDDNYNVFDDKFYLFKGEEFIMVSTGTTNTGDYGHTKFENYNDKGVAVIKTNEWYYRLWKHGSHKGKMKALVQNTRIKFYRDNNKNKKVDERGTLYEGYIGINFHTVTYKEWWGLIKKTIGGWSVGCQVPNNYDKYRKILNYLKNQKTITYCLIKEF